MAQTDINNKRDDRIRPARAYQVGPKPAMDACDLNHHVAPKINKTAHRDQVIARSRVYPRPGYARVPGIPGIPGRPGTRVYQGLGYDRPRGICLPTRTSYKNIDYEVYRKRTKTFWPTTIYPSQRPWADRGVFRVATKHSHLDGIPN